MRRIIGIVAAVALAAVGTLLLVGYVKTAEDRALAGEEVVPVLVADQTIEKGTEPGTFATLVRTERIPKKIVADGAISDVADLDGLVAGIDLLPGEQLTIERFVTPQSLTVIRQVPPPAGFLEVTLSLEPDRAIGGAVSPGDRVAVVASFDPIQVGAVEPGTEEPEQVIVEGDDVFVGTTITDENGLTRAPNATGLLLRGVLVTNVQVEQLPRQPVDAEETPEDTPALAPTGNLLITLAVTPGNLSRVVFSAEHGHLWLAADESGTPDTPIDTPVQTRESVYR